MENLSLNENGRGIKEPSGKKITASTLEVGKTYLHQNRHFLRSIVELFGRYVHYRQVGRKYPFEWYAEKCTRSHFAQICPNEATEDEIEFLKKKRQP